MAWKYPVVKRGMKVTPGTKNWGAKAVGGMHEAGKKSFWEYKGKMGMGGSKTMEHAVRMGKGMKK